MPIGPDLVTPHSLPTPAGRKNNFWYVRRDPDDVIVFIHGIFSSSLTCWLHEAGDQRVYWPDLIRGDQRFGEASIYMAGYYTASDAGDFSISQCAREVFEALQTIDADGNAAVMNARRVRFICHSTGGIVARYMIDRHLHEFQAKAVGLALIASPSLGSVWANIAELAARYYNQRLGQQLQWCGESVEDIHFRFKDLVNERATRLPGLFGMEACENKMVFRNRLWPLLRMFLPPRLKVVSTLSAGQYFGEVKVLRETDHFSSVKPDSVNHPAHEFLVTFEREFARASERVGIAGRAVLAAASTAVLQPSDESDVADWPAPSTADTTFFLGDAGFEALSGPAVVCCVVVDDSAGLSASLASELDQWLSDPYLREVPFINEVVRRRALQYGALDPDLRSRLVEWLTSQLFEAYICFTRGSMAPDRKDAMLEAVLHDRLVASRTRRVTIAVNAAAPADRDRASVLIERVRMRIADAAPSCGYPEVMVESSSRHSAGLTISSTVAEIVRARLQATSEMDSRPFGRVHPQKIRVMRDLDTGVRYTRRRPFAG
jgi:pimeloyl-ACP methyl ester carboxylesterase